MNKLLRILMVAATIALEACQPKESRDPITLLERELLASSGTWMNGFVHPIYLPPDASAEDIVSAKFLRPIRNQGWAKEFEIVERRYMHIPFADGQSQPQAILTRTDLGYQILVATYFKVGGFWNVEVYPGWTAE